MPLDKHSILNFNARYTKFYCNTHCGYVYVQVHANSKLFTPIYFLLIWKMSKYTIQLNWKRKLRERNNMLFHQLISHYYHINEPDLWIERIECDNLFIIAYSDLLNVQKNHCRHSNFCAIIFEHILMQTGYNVQAYI